MNPFENDNTINTLVKNDEFASEFQITIWKESKGRKTNSYISGWNLEQTELKQYLKEFKVKHGCNGSLKKEGENSILQFQGDKIDTLINFMIEKGVEEDYIQKKGQ